MYCEQCGTEMTENREVCPNCGTTLKNTKSKSTTTAIVLSIVWTGLGQLYNGQIVKGVALWIVCLIGLMISPILGIIVWACGIWDAYDVAKGTQIGITNENKNTSSGITFVKGFFYSVIILFGLVCIGAFVYGVGEGISEDGTTSSASTSKVTTSPPTPTVNIGTYENPAPLGEAFLSKTGTLRITLTEVERGNQVYAFIANENMFNDEPSPGNEYMVVKTKFEYLDGDRKFPLSGYDFKAYANDVECETPFLVMPDKYPEMGSIDLMPGGSVEKWNIYEVPKDEQVTIAYERLFVSAIYYFNAGSGNYP